MPSVLPIFNMPVLSLVEALDALFQLNLLMPQRPSSALRSPSFLLPRPSLTPLALALAKPGHAGPSDHERAHDASSSSSAFASFRSRVSNPSVNQP